MPRGRPDPFRQVADGGRVHLVPDPQILQQDGPQLDEPQGRLASGDDGVHAGTVAVVGADAAVAIAIECRGVAARPAVTLAGDEIDERRFLSLLHGLPLSDAGQGERGVGADESRGLWWPGTAGFGPVYGANPLSPRGKSGFERRIGAFGRPKRPAQDDEPVRKYQASAPSSWIVAST
jgi:hypothetical protein